jgi:hypothetical protein
MNSFWALVFEKLNAIITLLNGGSYDLNSEDGVIRNSYWKTLVEKINLIIASLINSGGGPGVFVREYNGEVGIGVDVIPSGNSPTVAGNEGDYYFTLAFNSAAIHGLPEGWIIIPWDRVAGMWELSSTLLPISAKDLHWVAVKNGTDVDGYYVILTGDTVADLPKWELLGAAAVVPDGETIDYNAAGKLEAKAQVVSSTAQGDMAIRANRTAFLNKPVNITAEFRNAVTLGAMSTKDIINNVIRYGDLIIVSSYNGAILQATAIESGSTLFTVDPNSPFCTKWTTNTLLYVMDHAGTMSWEPNGTVRCWAGVSANNSILFQMVYFCKGE